MKYNDPLHINSANLVVEYNGKEALILSKTFLDQQNAWGNLEAIKEAYWFKLVFYEIISETTDNNVLKSLVKDLTEIEYHLQELWGFPADAKFHRFWEYPKCVCGTINRECPLHGI